MQIMESRSMYALAILGCIIIIVAVFLILGLDKVIIKPLIKNYATLDMHSILDQSKLPTLFTANISDLDSYWK
jgi:hypothetical protein